MSRIAITGANGRVGEALARHLAHRHDLIEVRRELDEPPADFATRAARGAEVVVNAAGVAHIVSPSDAELQRLASANAELPAALAAAAVAARAHLIHISSVKAVNPGTSPYAASKRDGELALQRTGAHFTNAGLAIIVLRPMALLFPPLDAGKVSKLAILRRVPACLVPPLKLPVLAPGTFLSAVDDAIESATTRSVLGFHCIDFGRHDRGTLRDVRAAFVAARSLR